VLQENLSGIRVVKAFAAEEYEKEKFEVESSGVAGETYRAERLWAQNFAIMNFSFIAMITLILWVGGQEVNAGKSVIEGQVVYSGLTPGDLTAFIFYMGLLTMPVRMTGFLVNSFSRAASSGERIFEILDAVSPVIERPGARSLGRVAGHVAFENVSFSYDGGSTVLKDISVDVQPGHTVALLGRPGSGKTTMVHLLSRYYDVTSGRVTIDGTDVRDMLLTSLRDNIGLVQQDVFIHTATIRENIAYGVVDAPFQRVQEMAKIAQLHEFIVTLPDGYDSMVGERGVGLSGGQKQRLSIARTLMRDPPILVMDDSTSSVDAHTERMIQDAMEAVVKGRTTFIITHRLSALRGADTILVFKEGQIVERGTHQELLARGGEYREIYELQLLPGEESGRREATTGSDRRVE
jgi:ATP-binding cassette subfamily B protein